MTLKNIFSPNFETRKGLFRDTWNSAKEELLSGITKTVLSLFYSAFFFGTEFQSQPFSQNSKRNLGGGLSGWRPLGWTLDILLYIILAILSLLIT
jgi:hypothetical protein